MIHKIKIYSLLTLSLLPCIQIFATLPQWRIEAEARIYTNRMRDIEIMVKDTSGTPISNATVNVLMQQHDFLFGTAAAASIFSKAYLGQNLTSTEQKFHDYTLKWFNTVVLGNDLKWRFENENTEQTVKNAINYLATHHVKVRGHVMLWPHQDKAGETDHDFLLSDGVNYSNSDIKTQWNNANQQDSPSFTSWIQQSVIDRINRMGSTYGNTIAEWDVLNEANDYDGSGSDIWLERRWSTNGIDLIGGGNNRPTATGKQQLADIRGEWFRLASLSGTNAKLYWNNFQLLNEDEPTAIQRNEAYANMVAALNDPNRVNAPNAIQGVGMQAHMGGPILSAETIWNRLELVATVNRNVKLAITEYDFVPSLGMTQLDEATQLKNLLIVFFSHPQARSFTMWGIYDATHWRGNSPMYDDQWNLKAPGEVFTDLVYGDWWTDETTQTASNGSVTVRAFHGEQKITAIINGKEYSTTIWLDDSSDIPLQVTITP